MINELSFREYVLEQQEPYKVCDLQKFSGWPTRKISRHLTMLEGEGLILRKAKWFYKTVPHDKSWKDQE